MMSITETKEYSDVEYLIFSIRKNYLHYLSGARLRHFEIPPYLTNLVKIVSERFEKTNISADEMLEYMLKNDINNWVYYYASVFIIPTVKNGEQECVKDVNELFFLVLAGYILDFFRSKRIDIDRIIKGESLLHKTN